MKDPSGKNQETIQEHDQWNRVLRDSDPSKSDLGRTEGKFGEKDQFLESMVRSSAVATFVVDVEHRVICWNRACEDLTGMQSEDLLGTRDHWKPFYDSPRPCVADIIIDNNFHEMSSFYSVYSRSVLIPEGIRAEGWYSALGGKDRYILFDAAPIRDDHGRMVAAIETLQDITYLKRAELIIQEEKNLSESIINSLPGIFYLFDAEGKFLRWNKNFKIFSGCSDEEILERHPTDFFDDQDKKRVQQGIRDTLVRGKASLEARFICQNGAGVPYFLTGTRIEINKGPHVMGLGMDISDRKRMEAEIQEMSLRDQLTNLYNRRGFITLAEQQIRLADRAQRRLHLTFIDCDGMKGINDTLGHEEGDRALIATAAVLRRTFRKSDIIARQGGDEFAVLSIDVAEMNSHDFSKRLQENIDTANAAEARPYKLAMSWGMTVYDPQSPLSLDELMSAADKRMYAQKKAKSNRIL